MIREINSQTALETETETKKNPDFSGLDPVQIPSLSLMVVPCSNGHPQLREIGDWKIVP